MSDIRYIADKLYESNDEYISKRDAALSVNAVVTGCESKETMEALATVLVNIHHVPLADVAPVVHGRWEVVYNSVGKQEGQCTHCGKNSGILITKKSYCPNCGAKMDAYCDWRGASKMGESEV